MCYIENYKLSMPVKKKKKKKTNLLILLQNKLANYNNNSNKDKLKYLKPLINDACHEIKQLIPETDYEIVNFLNELINLI